MDGEAVNNKFNQNDIKYSEELAFTEAGRKKYVLKKLYEGKELQEHG